MSDRRWIGTAAALLTLALLVAGCSGGDGGGDARGDDGTTTPPARAAAAAELASIREAVGDGTCDALDAANCLLPFPSDRFTVADRDTPTGRRLALPAGRLPNVGGSTFDPTEWNRSDGFSPGTPILTLVPGVDPGRSGAPPIGDVGRSLAEDSPTVLVDLDTGERLPHWAELDATAPAGRQLLILRGARALPEGHRIGVALRGLTDASGTTLPTGPVFAAYRDNRTTTIDAVESRRGDMEELFTGLGRAGVDRSDLQMAWAFTVASSDSIAGRMLHLRDDAFDRLGTAAPAFRIDTVQDQFLLPGIGRLVVGSFDVPLYLTGGGEPGSTFNGGEDGRPDANGTYRAFFTCQMPAEALAPGAEPARPVVYGHGLLGAAGEAQGTWVARVASTNNMLYCATNWIGLSEEDLGSAFTALRDISEFPAISDRSQQGILNTLFLARLMKHPEGLAAHPALRRADGTPAIDTAEVYYDGNSQGGIMGAAATAVSQEWTKAVLGVPGMNYSLLLNRSVDFDLYGRFLKEAYPDPIDEQIIYGVLQVLWDRSEGNGYAQHTTRDPYPDTPRHQVLLHVGFGDFQVPQVAAEIQARTLGARLRTPALADGRHPDERPFFGLEPVEEFPTSDSVLVYWDSGTIAPPPQNITPKASAGYAARCGGLSKEQQDLDPVCGDSHEDPRRAEASMRQKDLFFRPGAGIPDTCGGEPCRAPKAGTVGF